MRTDRIKDYRTLEQIRQRKDELRRQIDRDGQHIEGLWGKLFVKREESTRGEFIANIISHSALAIDTFLMVRKLRRDYSGLFSFLKRKR
ncbi:MAG: hypothetical protein K6G08_03925 [Prevotella sp.]|nr:hypothetical protein [Prevotella sp.]